MATVFTQVRLGELPGNILYQDDLVFVLMTIAPHNPGHVLVVPVEEIGNLEDLEEEVFLQMLRITQQMMHVLKVVYGSPKVAVIVSGADLPDHAHIHVLPQYASTDIDSDRAKPTDQSKLADEADKIRAYLTEHPIR